MPMQSRLSTMLTAVAGLAVWGAVPAGCGGPAPAPDPAVAPGTKADKVPDRGKIEVRTAEGVRTGADPVARPGTDPAPAGSGTPTKSPARTADPKTDAPAKPNLLARIFGAGEKTVAADDPAPDPATGPHTIRLRTFTGEGHQTRAVDWVRLKLSAYRFDKGFVVDQGDRSIVCHGEYLPPKQDPKSGRMMLPDALVDDMTLLQKHFRDPGDGAVKVSLDYVPLPQPAGANPYRIETARGEWTLHCMSFFGEPDSKAKAQLVAKELRALLGVPVFVVPNEEQFLLCVGDFEENEVSISREPPNPNKTAGAAAKPAGRPGAIARASGQVPGMVLMKRGFVADKLYGDAESPRAKALWEELKQFGVNGKRVVLAGAGNTIDRKPAYAMSTWLRVPDLKTNRAGAPDGVSTQDASFLLGGN